MDLVSLNYQLVAAPKTTIPWGCQESGTLPLTTIDHKPPSMVGM
jgi:hypothetical protein